MNHDQFIFLMRWIYNDGLGREVFPDDILGEPCPQFALIKEEATRKDNESDSESAVWQSIDHIRCLVRTNAGHMDTIEQQYKSKRLHYDKESKTIVGGDLPMTPSQEVLA